jgi:hypothetical protein
VSYDIYLRHADSPDPIEFMERHQLTGGTYQIGGTTRAWLNVTYNYSQHFRRVLDPEVGIRVLYGKTVSETLPLIATAITALGQDVDDDYWKATEGNARAALLDLFALAARVPADAVWDGD